MLFWLYSPKFNSENIIFLNKGVPGFTTLLKSYLSGKLQLPPLEFLQPIEGQFSTEAIDWLYRFHVLQLTAAEMDLIYTNWDEFILLPKFRELDAFWKTHLSYIIQYQNEISCEI